MRKKIFRFHIVLFTFISLWSQAQVIRVAPTPSGSGNGSSWANASSLQNAIAIASSNSQIWVKQGNYPVSSTLLVSLSNISIYGGFAGDETALNQRDWTNNTTVFNGQNTVKIMRFSSNNGIIDGIHFRNGFVTGTVNTTNDGGGALRLTGFDQIIRNCTFLNNISTSDRGGGAIFIWYGGGQLIENCIFENNTHTITTTNSNGGGAIHNWDEDVTIRNCRFINNSSSRSGGAIYSWGENFKIEGSRFVNNNSDDNGGAIHINSDDLLLTNSFFSGNTADDSGGAIHNDKLLKVSNSLFINNNASNLGGAIYNREELAVTNSTFVNNNNTAIIHSRFSPSQFSNYSTHIYNSIFYGNTPKAADFFSDISPSTGINSNDDSEKDIRRNIVQEYNLGTNNMIGVNPQFVNNTNNFTLQTSSPAINAGNNTLYNQVSPTNATASTDLNGNPRLFGIAVDYGAYELQQIITPSVPSCTSVTIPANGATNIDIATNISWTAVTGATSYTLQIGTASGTWNILNQNVGNVTTFDLPNDLNYSTQYFVRIIPSNSAGNATGCTVTNFTTEAQPITVPACTAATIPANGATSIDIATNFSWTAVTGATSYTLQIGTASGTWDIINQNVGSGTTFNLPNDLDYSTQYFIRIIPSNSAGPASGCSVTNFTTEPQPITIPACTTATTPADGATNIAIGTNFSWNAVAGATSYTLQIGTASGTWDIINQNVGSGTTFNLPNDLDYSTQYFVRIIPRNSAGNATGCTVTNFTTEAQPITVPACTSATIPANGATNIAIGTNFSWNAVAGATSYTLQIGTASGTWDIINQNVGSGTTFNLPNDLDYSTQYFVRIIPRNSAGNATGCTVTNFTTEAQPITVPACTAATIPANGATSIDIATNFSWTAVTGATSYTLQIGTASGTWDILNQNVGNVTTFNLPNDLNYSTQYFVRIIPRNSAGNATGCTVTNFTTEAQPITVPACTAATTPANGATNIDIATNISWTAVTGATSYTLQIGTASGTWNILNQNVGNVTTFDLPNDLNYSTQYFVRIIPSNSAGNATGCTVTNFTTEAQPITVPACTAATIPANGATSIDIATNFSWTAVTGATSYTLQIGTASGTWDIINQNVGSGTTFNLPNDLDYSTQYFIRIIPSNSAGPASGCSVTNFTTEPQPITIPACTTATTPADGATNIAIGTNFSWNAVAGATSYTLQIGTASGTWNILNQDVGNVTTFDLPTNLNYSTQYFVRIIPRNSAGNATGCTVTNFTTEAQPITVPACTSATIPANGATNIGIATNFSWTAVTGATSYTLQIGTVSGTWDILNQNVGNVTTFDLPNDLNYSTQYFVRIIPSNSAGQASGCSVTNFITQAQPITVPACTAATVPANGATNIGIATNFSWTAVTGATSYTLQIGTASGTWNILNQNVGNVTTFDLPNNLNYSTQYFVRIIPSNSAGQASGCSVTNFITQAQPITVPACTAATVPANGATNIGIATNFSWTAVTGATSYTLQIGTASGTWNILNQDVGNVTTFDLPTNLNYSTQYFVRIIPSNLAGQASGCSVTNFITVYGDEDGDGVTDDKDQCPNTPLGIPVDSNGCPVCSAPLMTTINIQENDAEISFSGGISPFNYRVDNGLWQSTSSNSIVLNDLEGGLHTIEINSADTCETILEFSIIEMHNVITPNGDGINDVLDLSTLLLKEEPKLIIVDRYSNKIFEGNANNQFIWDGKLNGRPIKTDSYWFYMEWKEPNSQTPSKKQGWILVKNR